MKESEYAVLFKRLLRPERPRLAEARAVVAGIVDAQEAWEALATHELIPVSWVHDEGRSFRALEPYPPRDRFHPTPPDSAAAVAAAAKTIAACEACARDLVARLGPWGQRACARIVWSLLPPRKLRQAELRAGHSPSTAFRCAADAAGFAPSPKGDTESLRLTFRHNKSSAQLVFVRDVREHEKWSRAAAGRTAVSRLPERWPSDPPDPTGFTQVPPELLGRSFADLPNPFDPLLAIWRLGCTLVAIDGDALVLAYPLPPAEVSP